MVLCFLIIPFATFCLLKTLSTKAHVSIPLNMMGWLKGKIVSLRLPVLSCCLLCFHHTYGEMQFSLQLILLIKCLPVSFNFKPLLNASRTHTLPCSLFLMPLLGFLVALPLSIVMALTKLSLPLVLRNVSSLGILFTNEVINASTLLLDNTSSPWMQYLLRINLLSSLVIFKGKY